MSPSHARHDNQKEATINQQSTRFMEMIYEFTR